jgi:hypothetical protein
MHGQSAFDMAAFVAHREADKSGCIVETGSCRICYCSHCEQNVIKRVGRSDFLDSAGKSWQKTPTLHKG